jgi:hypothetical protein
VLKAAGEKDSDKGKDQAGESGKEKNAMLKSRNPFLKQSVVGDSIRGVVKPKESTDEYDGDVVEF